MFPRGGIRIARLLGIDILINPTWLLIFVLVGVSLTEALQATSFRGRDFPSGAPAWVFGFATAAVFFACLLAHELSHSIVAMRNGLRINRITLFLFGGVAEMSEDVPDAGTELKMAAAGPLMSFALAGAFYGLYRLVASLPSSSVVWVAPLYFLFYINAFVALFNLLPGFPLDGGRVLRAIIWKITGDLRKATRAASTGGQVIAVLLVGLGIYMTAIGQLGGLWLVLIAVFVFQLSRASYRQTLYRVAVADTRVRDLMQPPIPAAVEGTTLTALMTQYFNVYHLPAFPVVDGNGLVTGIVGRDDLTSVNPSEWDVLDAARVARPLDEEMVVDPDDSLDRVLRRATRPGALLLVMRDGRVEGVLTADALLGYIKARVGTGA